MKHAKRIYELAIAAGVLAAVYLYGFAFNDFSETELVRLSYGWIGAFVFGTHGLIACELKEIVEAGQAETTSEALQVRKAAKDRSFFSRIASGMLWSFLLTTAATDRKQPLLSALLATAVWVVLLVFFFETIFPAL